MIDGISAATNLGSTTATGASGSAATDTNFETFLKMLTTQLRNQDPLNPMEGSDFAVQLATFSGVEQQAQTNKLLSQVVGQMSGGLSQMADLIGKEVRTTAPVSFTDQPLTLDITHDLRADSVVLVTLDAAGNEVTREEIGTGEGQVDWLGRDLAGDKLADGQYSFVAESWLNGEKINENQIGAYARVTEAEVVRGEVTLIFEGGSSAPASEVTAIRSGG